MAAVDYSQDSHAERARTLDLEHKVAGLSVLQWATVKQSRDNSSEAWAEGRVPGDHWQQRWLWRAKQHGLSCWFQRTRLAAVFERRCRNRRHT